MTRTQSYTCQNKFILSDNFDRKVCNGLQSTKIIQLLNLSTQLDNTNLGQPITKQCLILFSLWCKMVALAIKEKKKHLSKTWSGQSVWKMFGPKFFINFIGSPLYEEFWGILCHS